MTLRDDPLLSIGELSRASGLTVSALRFYDREGVLVPAVVDRVTGYRRYSPDQARAARLLAGMRRVQVPVAEMVAVLEADGDADLAVDLLHGHLARLERGLQDARREVGRLCRIVREEGDPVAVTVPGGLLAAALASVRYAVGSDPDLPVLGGVLLDRDAEGVRTVATDRYRLALARLAGCPGGEPESVVLPADVVDRLLGSSPQGEVTVAQHGGEVTVTGPGVDLRADAVAGDYPDFRALLPDGPPPMAGRIDVAALRAALADLGDRRRVQVHPGGVLTDGGTGEVDGEAGDVDGEAGDVDGETSHTGGGPGGEVLVDAGYLWDTLAAVDEGHLVLPGAGTLAPLAVHAADDSVLSLVMPLRSVGAR